MTAFFTCSAVGCLPLPVATGIPSRSTTAAPDRALAGKLAASRSVKQAMAATSLVDIPDPPVVAVPGLLPRTGPASNQPAVDADHLARDIAGGVGQEKVDDRRHLVRLAHPRHRHRLERLLE